jgi:hypothetical protein
MDLGTAKNTWGLPVQITNHESLVISGGLSLQIIVSQQFGRSGE